MKLLYFLTLGLSVLFVKQDSLQVKQSSLTRFISNIYNHILALMMRMWIQILIIIGDKRQ